MRFLWGFISAVVLFFIGGAFFGIFALRGSALHRPPRYETFVVNTAKSWFIPRAPQITPLPEKNEEAVLEGGAHFNHHCAICHDLSGDADSEFAESFHPPVADLTSKRVQAYSDRQLKWIIDNGIRYTGMPGWRKSVADDDGWKMVYYMRILHDPEQAGKYRELLMQRGKWKVETPAAHEGEDAHDEQPAEESEDVSPDRDSGDENSHQDKHDIQDDEQAFLFSNLSSEGQ
jgi:mono/diheme cytochrome c family protein